MRVGYKAAIRWIADEDGGLEYRLSEILNYRTVAMASALFGLERNRIACDVLRRRLRNGFADPQQVTDGMAAIASTEDRFDEEESF
jgi:hypothetical protein